MTLHGFDVSAYQSATWTRPCDFLLVKATEGASYTNSRFKTQWAGAKEHAKHRGAYHFARPEASNAASQAARFLTVVKPVPGESVWLDLEASKLTQSQTNAWARAWGDYIRQHAPGVTSGIYMGSGYASNGTGRDLNQHFDLWWYPQYPGAYQLRPGVDIETIRAENRSETAGRALIAATTTKWPSAMTPWLPSGLTCGWKTPHIWQFTDNWQGLDASITALTVTELAGGAAPKPQPKPQPKPWPGRLLELKSPLMHGSDVTWVQQHLNTHGASPKLKTDGYYGKLTAAAVRAFQKKQHLTVDGIVGAKTWGALAK